MLILAIETSCDETAAAICENGRRILAGEVLSQADMHALYGGVVPEIASRRHIETLGPICSEAVAKSGVAMSDIGAIAVTCAPGLIGALLVGVSFAKSASKALNIPLVPVHHIRGHIAACYIAFPELTPPFCALVASGGHTLIIDVEDYTKMRVLGSTRDDAAGEAFDKCARILGLGYPGGTAIDSLSNGGDDAAFSLPRASVSGNPLDMSFSGLKTAVINLVHNSAQKGEPLDKSSLAASFQAAVSDALAPRVIAAAKACGRNVIVGAGGVIANSRIRRDLETAATAAGMKAFLPPPALCGDNAAMIGCQGYYEFLSGSRAGDEQNAYATMPADASFPDMIGGK